MKKYCLFFIFLLCKLIIISSCANIILPTGGKKDSLPPVLLTAIPKDSSFNFNTNRITLEFDEYIQLDNDLQNSLIVSPYPENTPVILGKLRTVSIKLRDSLMPNTTYAINFGNALKDINEGNPIKNFTYVFSTGNKIDEGKISGKVQLAETGGIDSTLIVVLHTDLNDSAVKKGRPVYFTRLDSGGNFKFNYLPKKQFAIYVLPNDYSKKYDDSTKLFAFFNQSVSTDSNNAPPVILFAYQQEKREEKSAAKPATQSSKDKNKKAEKPSLQYTTSLDNGQQSLLSDLIFSFTTKIKTFDSSKIILSDTNYKAVTGYTIVQDTSLTKFILHYPWQENQYFKLMIQPGAFADSAGTSLAKIDTITLATKSESAYGSIRLRFTNLDVAKNPVLLFFENSQLKESIPLMQTELYRKLYEPGDYELRILYDENKNGVWDAGNFDLKKQPEIVQQIPKQINVKVNWDNEVTINL